MNLYDALKQALETFDDDFGKKVDEALAEIVRPSREELLENLLEQYRKLLPLLQERPPRDVKLSAEDPGVLFLDGKKYEPDVCFSWEISPRNRQGAECYMAIEALFSDLREVSADPARDIAYLEEQLRTP